MIVAVPIVDTIYGHTWRLKKNVWLLFAYIRDTYHEPCAWRRGGREIEHGWRSISEDINAIQHYESKFFSYKAQRKELSRCWL